MAIHAVICVLLLVAEQGPPQPPAKPRRTCESLGHPLFGSVVCAPGDADGDGVPDFVVADVGWNRDTSCPRAWLISGSSDQVLFTRALDGGLWDLELGIIGVADFDGDDVGDWLLSPGWRRSRQPPCLMLASGKSGALIRDLDPNGELPALKNRQGSPLKAPVFGPAVMNGKALEEQPLGFGDLDHDGLVDVAVGGNEWVELRSGKDGSLLRRLVEPPSSEARGFGRTLALLNDLDGDGIGDIAISSPDVDVGAGKVQAFSTGTGRCVWRADLDMSAWHWGQRLASLGDIDGDGFSDLGIATMNANSCDPGRACIVSGKSGRILTFFMRPDGELLIAGTRPSARVKLPLYSGAGYPLFGSALANAGDMDRDGRGDFLIGDPGSPLGGVPARAWLVSGREMRVCATILLYTGNSKKDLLPRRAIAVGLCGDVDKDGRRDWILGCRGDPGFPGWTAELMSGASFGLIASKRGEEAWPELEPQYQDLGDLDGDGREEQLVRETLNSVSSLEVHSSSGAVLYRVGALPNQQDIEGFGASFAIVDDLDGDGMRDFVAGCDNRESLAPGRVFVYSGKTGTLLAMLGRKAEAIERLPLERR